MCVLKKVYTKWSGKACGRNKQIQDISLAYIRERCHNNDWNLGGQTTSSHPMHTKCLLFRYCLYSILILKLTETVSNGNELELLSHHPLRMIVRKEDVLSESDQLQSSFLTERTRVKDLKANCLDWCKCVRSCDYL